MVRGHQHEERPHTHDDAGGKEGGCEGVRVGDVGGYIYRASLFAMFRHNLSRQRKGGIFYNGTNSIDKCMCVTCTIKVWACEIHGLAAQISRLPVQTYPACKGVGSRSVQGGGAHPACEWAGLTQCAKGWSLRTVPQVNQSRSSLVKMSRGYGNFKG